mmetsp:Transcript_20762/g.41122  ORF Transcript_20762/g.41122 Transcript_20762/m.41122 type:complete len:574 (-) Transcript_20762:278-1999(-)
MARKRGARRIHRDPSQMGIQTRKMSELLEKDEGILYTVQVGEQPIRKPKPRFSLNRWVKKKFYRDVDDDLSAMEEEDEPRVDLPQSSTLRGKRSGYAGSGKIKRQQFTIKPKKQYENPILNWIYTNHLDVFPFAAQNHNTDQYLYRPSAILSHYIHWTFRASFTFVFLSSLLLYYAINLIFALLLLEAGRNQPECIPVSGDKFGTIAHTSLSDAFALSWNTFTTVGYGMSYTSTGNNFGKDTRPEECSGVVFLCTAEAFVGLLYAGMCTAVMFGKVHRIQSHHAHLIFCNAVCLQYEEVESDDVDDDENESASDEHREDEWFDDKVDSISAVNESRLSWDLEESDPSNDEENPSMKAAAQENELVTFVAQFNGCPVLKFQVVNMLANKEGSEMVDAIMKIIGVKLKTKGDVITQSQYVRVNLVDYEHPFFSKVWHGVHVLDSNSTLLTNSARKKIQDNGGSWPSEWFKPKIIHDILDFEDLVVTVAGISSVSAVSGYAYKRYKKGDVLIGFNFAPLVFENDRTGLLEVDMVSIAAAEKEYCRNLKSLNHFSISVASSSSVSCTRCERATRWRW